MEGPTSSIEVEAVEEDSDDGVVLGSKGLHNISVDCGAVLACVASL